MKHRQLVIVLLYCQFLHADIHHYATIANEYCYLAQKFHDQGDTSRAFDYYKKALELNPENSLALTYFGIKPQKNGTTTTTESPAKSKAANTEYELGITCFNEEKTNEAIIHFRTAISFDLAHEQAYFHLGKALEKQKKYTEAIDAYKKVISLNSNAYDAYHQLGHLYRNAENLESAAYYFEKAYTLKPKDLSAIMELANTLNMLDENEKALELYQKILDINPNILSALYNFGFTLKKIGLYDRALEVYNQVLKARPDYAAAHFSMSSIYLIKGDYEKGFEEYEWRWQMHSEQERKFHMPIWKGQDLSDKTLLIYAEQGVGDTFQFIRFIPYIKQTYGTHVRVVLECQDPLIPLLKKQPYIDHIFSRNGTQPHADYYIALLSVPTILKTRIETIPSDNPYITVPDELVSEWKKRLAQDKNFKVGICWQGNARYSTLALRQAVAAKSITLEKLAPLFEIPHVSIYSLQRVDGIDQIDSCSFKNKLITFNADFDKFHGRFMDTAAVMKNLDLVISVDTGVCHLAGALGVPTWIPLQLPNDWRWLLNRSDSVWYPNVRLFRQTKAKDWQPVVLEMAHTLNLIVNGDSSPHTKNDQTKKNIGSEPTIKQKKFFEYLLGTL